MIRGDGIAAVFGQAFPFDVSWDCGGLLVGH